jgi:hypothetical protein
MASVDTRAIEGEIDRIRSLGLEELRREWRRLYLTEPPRISRDLLVPAPSLCGPGRRVSPMSALIRRSHGRRNCRDAQRNNPGPAVVAQWRRTKARAPPSSTTAPRSGSRRTRWRGSGFSKEAPLFVADLY